LLGKTRDHTIDSFDLTITAEQRIEARGLLSAAMDIDSPEQIWAETYELLEGSWHGLVRPIMRGRAVSGKSPSSRRCSQNPKESLKLRCDPWLLTVTSGIRSSPSIC
jgi:hypothetical protein